MSDEARSYPVPIETLPSLDPSYHLQDLIEIREFIESRGIDTKNTRIERYGKYLERSISDGYVDAATIFKNSVGEPFQSPVDWQLYVIREVHELAWILKGLNIHKPLGTDKKLGDIVGGRDFAALDIDSHSRNAQFEFRIASYFCQNGCDVDMSTDTDIIARRDRCVFYVECKRIGSRNKLAMRLSEARGQLARRMPRRTFQSRLLGCIAIDVTKVAFPHNGLTWAISSDHSRDVIQDKLIDVRAKANASLSFDSCPKLFCYWLQVHIPALIMQPAPGAITSRFSSYYLERPKLKRKDAMILATFHKMFESVSKLDSRASPGQVLNLRNTGTFPAGMKFGLDDSRILELLDRVTLSDDEKSAPIGSLVFDGIEDKFIFFEVCLLSRDLIDDWKGAMSDDKAMGSLMLLTSLYQARYPYEESERIARPGSLTSPAASEDVS